MAYLNLSMKQVEQMADSALNNYEFSCSWRNAHRAAAEFCMDEFGGKCRPSAVKLAVRLAQVRWEGYRLEAQRTCSEDDWRDGWDDQKSQQDPITQFYEDRQR